MSLCFVGANDDEEQQKQIGNGVTPAVDDSG